MTSPKSAHSNEKRLFLNAIVQNLLTASDCREPEWSRIHHLDAAKTLLDEKGLTWSDLIEAQLTDLCKFDFEKIYQRFPRKIGRKLGLQRAKRFIRTADRFAQLELSVENYREYHRRMKTDQCYLLHFSTFMNRWEDYLDPSIFNDCPPDQPKLREEVPKPEDWSDL